MKIQIASDLHLELWQRDYPDIEQQFRAVEDRDLLILAGDITDGNRDFGKAFLRRELGISPVVYVPGNHEYYYSTRYDVDAFWRSFAKKNPRFHYLNNDTVEIGGLTFYGAEWCSDFWGLTPHLFHMAVEDFRVTPGWDTYGHLQEYRTIKAKLTKLAGDVDVVVTHFPPTLEAIDLELYQNNKLNPYFINDDAALVRRVGAKLWVSGHTHSPFDYRVGDTRVVGNPRGYPHEPARPGFSETKTVEVAA